MRRPLSCKRVFQLKSVWSIKLGLLAKRVNVFLITSYEKEFLLKAELTCVVGRLTVIGARGALCGK
jgi:hypothetical protein